MVRKVNRWLTLGLAAFAAAGALAQDAGNSALTLRQCVNEALGRSPELKAQRYEMKAAGDAIWQAQAALFPQVTGDALTQTLRGSSH